MTTAHEQDTPAPPHKTPYEMIGGKEKVRAIVERFYDLVETEPAFLRLRAMHARDLAPMREQLSAYLGFWLGGPENWKPLNGGGCVMSLHARFQIDKDHAQQWIDAMSRAIDDCAVETALAKAMKEAMVRMCAGMINAE